MYTRVLQQDGMLVWNVTASSVTYTPLTSPPSAAAASSSSSFAESSLSFLSDRHTVVRSLGTEVEGEEEVEGEGEEGSDDILAMFSHRSMQGKNDNVNDNENMNDDENEDENMNDNDNENMNENENDNDNEDENMNENNNENMNESEDSNCWLIFSSLHACPVYHISQ